MSMPELSRRAALAGVVAGLAASGCDLQDPETPQPEAAPDPDPTAATSPVEDPDTALVASVRAEIGAVLSLVTAASERPALRRELAPWRRLHAEHLDAVPGAETADEGPPVTGGTGLVRSRVRSRERLLARALADASVEASSGPLAALLGSMSAAVSQRLAATEATA